MKKIGLISDTHNFVHPAIDSFFRETDEIWHAGDIGNQDIIPGLRQDKAFRAVYGNIDGPEIRAIYPEYELFEIERMKILMLHIGGYPGKYSPRGKTLIRKENPDVFISGHSHILKAIYDDKNKLLHLNPGAAGKAGFHKRITFMRFIIEEDHIRDLEVKDLPRSGSSQPIG
jgi:hypothetical protein